MNPYQKIKRLRILVVALIAIIAFTMIEYALGVHEYDLKKMELTELKVHDEIIIGSLLQFADYQQGRIEELQSANEMLIKYSEPKSCIRAIKKTKLPSLKRG